MKKTITIITVIVFGLIALMFWGKSNKASEAAEIPQDVGKIGAVEVSEKIFDFGAISMKNGLVDHVFKITNSSDKDVSIKKISTSCMCTNAYMQSASGEKGPFGMEGHGGYVPPANETIKAGESRDVRVVYDPNAHGPAGVGAIDRLVYLTDASGNTIQLEVKAIVTP
jgi:hypothetical protein